MSVHASNNTNAHTSTAPHHKVGAWEIIVGSDLLNVLILAFAIIYLGNKFLPKIVNERKKQISKELEDARLAKTNANKELQSIKEKVQRADIEVDEIKQEANKASLSIKKQFEEETKKELEDLKLKINKEIGSKYDEAIQDIKKSATNAAIKLAEESLSLIVKNKEIQNKLISSFMAELESPSKN